MSVTLTMASQKCRLLTDADAFAGRRRQNERDDGDDGEEAARQNEVDEIVERLATYFHCEPIVAMILHHTTGLR